MRVEAKAVSDYQASRFWTNSLAPRDEPQTIADQRGTLRQGYLEMRANAVQLAAEIARDMPSLTVHDVTHLDALWHLAEELAGPDIALTPTEALVFGASVLIHDLGLGAAAYPGGRDEIRSDPHWRDAVAVSYKRRLGHFPSDPTGPEITVEDEEEALALILRNRHAERAQDLGMARWDSDGGDEYLFPAKQLRQAYGGLIGEIAGSHWWSLDKVAAQLNRSVNALPDHPASWSVDALKIALLLRIADAVHVDARRAPTFLRALRRPEGEAADHWGFQERLLRPTVVGDRVRLTSGKDFEPADESAWWAGFELVRLADRELRQVDDLLADQDLPRFQARGVLAAQDPFRLARLIRTHGWTLVDASVKVGDVAGLVKRMGGAKLYGDDPSVPLRELLQNASDAVRARRSIEERPASWGTIRIAIGGPKDKRYVEVTDTGVGMSTNVLTDTLLDFGSSIWRSTDLIREYPGLAGRGFESSGRFGIGFFSTLMWGEHVRVITRRPEEARGNTRVLELVHGVNARPLLRTAASDEQLREGGTSVRVDLSEFDAENWRTGIAAEAAQLPHLTSVRKAARLCARIAPASAVTTEVAVDGKSQIAVRADDWRTVAGAKLLARCDSPDSVFGALFGLRSCAHRLRPLRSAEGTVVGRACVSPFEDGVLTVGGFRAAKFPHIRGLLMADEPNLARNAAAPIVDAAGFRAWLEEQGRLLLEEDPDQWHTSIALTLKAYGLDYSRLPICTDEYGNPLTAVGVTRWAANRSEVVVLDGSEIEEWLSEAGYSDHRAGDIDHRDEYLEQAGRVLSFGIPDLDAPDVAVSFNDEICVAVAAAWDVEVDQLTLLDDSYDLGMLDEYDVEVVPFLHLSR